MHPQGVHTQTHIGSIVTDPFHSRRGAVTAPKRSKTDLHLLLSNPYKPPWRNFLHDCVPMCVLLSFVHVSPDLCDPALQGNDCGRLIIIVPHQSRKGKGSIGMKWWEPGGLLMAVALARLPSVSGFLPWSAVCLLECLLFWMHSIEDTNCIIHGRQAGNGKDEWWPQFLSWQRRSRE